MYPHEDKTHGQYEWKEMYTQETDTQHTVNTSGKRCPHKRLTHNTHGQHEWKEMYTQGTDTQHTRSTRVERDVHTRDTQHTRSTLVERDGHTRDRQNTRSTRVERDGHTRDTQHTRSTLVCWSDSVPPRDLPLAAIASRVSHRAEHRTPPPPSGLGGEGGGAPV